MFQQVTDNMPGKPKDLLVRWNKGLGDYGLLLFMDKALT